MIIWGSKGNVLTLGKVEPRYCPTCEKEQDFFITMLYRYGHVFWIPLFSWSTKYFYHCSICDSGVELKGSELKPYLSTNPKPFMHRFGWAIVGGIAIIAILIMQ